MVEAIEDSGPAELICSAKGCRVPAAYKLRWNNPKLHVPTARKTWLACTVHRESLSHFLDSRRFLREVWPIGAVADGAAVTDGAAATNGVDVTDGAGARDAGTT